MKEIKISEEPLKIEVCQEFCSSPEAGGIVTFTGTVRNKTKGKNVVELQFESFIPMAEKELNKIADYAIQNWSLLGICIHHRVGKLSIGEIPVVIVASSAHRKEAFEACQYAIDTLKKTVPIWKKEIFDDGEVWVAAHP